jgi:hypothetical protein
MDRLLLLVPIAALAACMSSDDDPSSRGQGTCYIGGCSGQVCSDRPDVVSTCEWIDAYACYRDARCERQSHGACGWTMTPALNACLAAS